MDFAVPDSVKRTLLEFEAREHGFREFDLFQAKMPRKDTRKTVHFRSRPSFFRSTLVQFCNLISSRRNSGVAGKLAI